MFSKNNLARKVETYTGSPLGSVDSGLLKSWSARVGLRHNGLGGVLEFYIEVEKNRIIF